MYLYKLQTTQLQSHATIVPVDFIIENPLNYTIPLKFGPPHLSTPTVKATSLAYDIPRYQCSISVHT